MSANTLTASKQINIGKLAQSSGVNAKLIRYYESIGLLPEARRTEAGYRLYSQSDIERLRFVRRSRSLGFGIDDIRQLISLWQNQNRASSEVKHLAMGHVQALEAKIAEMQAMSDVLRELAQRCQGDDQPNCPILHNLAQTNLASL